MAVTVTWRPWTVDRHFVACDREQELLLPPSLRGWLPEDRFVWFVLDEDACVRSL